MNEKDGMFYAAAKAGVDRFNKSYLKKNSW
jgi:hypothetical protein